jgi:ribonuclease HII
MDSVEQIEQMVGAASEAPSLCGLDEAGRGPLAGPLVAALVAFPVGFDYSAFFPRAELRDSKRLRAGQREELLHYIHEYALVVATEIITVDDINARDIGWANRCAFERLIMRVEAMQYMVDGNLKLQNLGSRTRLVKCVKDADETIQAVAAASVVAKVTRDRLMRQLHEQYPVYGWDRNAGYGTRAHLDALHTHGISPHHRRQFVATALARFEPKLPGFEESSGDQ